jgi:hypothetical protein
MMLTGFMRRTKVLAEKPFSVGRWDKGLGDGEWFIPKKKLRSQ